MGAALTKLQIHKYPQEPKCKAIAYDQVLAQTITKICVELPLAVSDLKLPNALAIDQSYQQKIRKKQDILQQLPELLKQGILDQETADLRTYKLRAEIAQLESKMAQLPPGNLAAIAQAVSLEQFWLDLSEAERRFYFREFIKQIDIVRNQANIWRIQLKFIF